MTTKLSEENFSSAVETGVTVVDFYADWCGPCRNLSPIMEELGEMYKNKVTVAKVNVDENQSISLKYNVRSIPTIIFFKDGRPVDRHVGLSTLNSLSNKINTILS